MATTNRLATIATRQRRAPLRDLVFAAAVVLAAVMSVTAIGTAAAVASTPSAPR